MKHNKGVGILKHSILYVNTCMRIQYRLCKNVKRMRLKL